MGKGLEIVLTTYNRGGVLGDWKIEGMNISRNNLG